MNIKQHIYLKPPPFSRRNFQRPPLIRVEIFEDPHFSRGGVHLNNERSPMYAYAGRACTDINEATKCMGVYQIWGGVRIFQK